MSRREVRTHAGDSVQVRPARAEDVPVMLRMMRTLAGGEDSLGQLHADEATLRRDGFAPQPRFHTLLAECEGAVVGYLTYTVGYSIWAAGTVMLMDDLFVVDTHRNLGIGRHLMDRLDAIRTEQGHALIRWTVEHDNTQAIRFYQSLGADVRIKGVCTWRTRNWAKAASSRHPPE